MMYLMHAKIGKQVLFLLLLSSSLYGQDVDFGELKGRLSDARSALFQPDSTLKLLVEFDENALPDSLASEVFKLKGLAFYHKGIMDSAIVHFTSAMALADSVGCNDQMAETSNGMGVVLQTAGLYREAIPYYTKSLGCAEYRGDSLLKLKIYNNLSVLNRELGNANMAMHYILKAKSLAHNQKSADFAGMYNSLGEIFLMMDEADSAMHYFNMSLSMRADDDLKGRASCLNNLGDAASKKGDFSSAMHFYDQAASIRERVGDLLGSASLFVNMANLSIELNRLTDATELLMNAELLSKKVNSLDLNSRLLASKALLEEKKGDFEKALHYQKQYSMLKESLRSEELLNEAGSAKYVVALVEAKNGIRRALSEEEMQAQIIRRQRLINLILALAMAVFIGLSALLVYQLRMLSNLRKTLTHERDEAERNALFRKETLNAVVHELRTPMNAIISLADLIHLESDPKEVKEMTSLLKKSSARLLEITNNVLTFSRLEQGSVQLVKEQENLSELVRDICKMLEPQAMGKKLEFTTDIDSDIHVEVDRGMLEIILMNLIGNALKYTKIGGVHVALNKEKSGVVIKVQDTGIGISAQDQERIFEPFYQSKDKAISKIEGSGLGLSICKHYADLLNIKLTVSSVLNEGTTFRLIF